MSGTKRAISIIILALWLAAFASCSLAPTVSAGKYYLDGDTGNPYIQIISDKKMKLVNFDIEFLTDYLIREGTDFVGDAAEAFKAYHNLPNAFQEEIEYEFDEHDRTIYVKALSSENLDYFVANYRMAYEDGNTITFMENRYARR